MVEKRDDVEEFWDKEKKEEQETEDESKKIDTTMANATKASSRKKQEKPKTYVGAMDCDVRYSGGFTLEIRIGEPVSPPNTAEIGRLLRYKRIKEG